MFKLFVFSLFLLGLINFISPVFASDIDTQVALSLASATRQRIQKETTTPIPTKPSIPPITFSNKNIYYEYQWINGQLWLVPIQSQDSSIPACPDGSLK